MKFVGGGAAVKRISDPRQLGNRHAVTEFDITNAEFENLGNHSFSVRMAGVVPAGRKGKHLRLREPVATRTGRERIPCRFEPLLKSNGSRVISVPHGCAERSGLTIWLDLQAPAEIVGGGAKGKGR